MLMAKRNLTCKAVNDGTSAGQMPAMQYSEMTMKKSVNAEMKKGHVINDMALNSGGTDGTRTRDPLRDRQVF